ncbi:hypothetical protein BU16DRAFT_538000 [Lophium mytilinum]|uniref:HeH/LEM domain-containing protein n=1 Tax=Lophium mytilinum TaxID=390894 RepID=A0A6A6R0C6_9PEZI|nr:hypothetical protein BU16DRAFT_538000 [Lophium mytilinum]
MLPLFPPWSPYSLAFLEEDRPWTPEGNASSIYSILSINIVNIPLENKAYEDLLACVPEAFFRENGADESQALPVQSAYPTDFEEVYHYFDSFGGTNSRVMPVQKPTQPTQPVASNHSSFAGLPSIDGVSINREWSPAKAFLDQHTNRASLPVAVDNQSSGPLSSYGYSTPYSYPTPVVGNNLEPQKLHLRDGESPSAAQGIMPSNPFCTPSPITDKPIPYERMFVPQLRALLEARNIHYTKKTVKLGLIEKLRNADRIKEMEGQAEVTICGL